MRVTILVSLGVLIAGTALFLFFRSPHSADTAPRQTEAEKAVNIAVYFEERLLGEAMEEVGQPKGGFTPEVLMGVFPVFIVADFDGVRAEEGKYSVKDDQVVFVRYDSYIETDAGMEISKMGYESLLKNVALRLNYIVRTEEGVNELVEELSR